MKSSDPSTEKLMEVDNVLPWSNNWVPCSSLTDIIFVDGGNKSIVASSLSSSILVVVSLMTIHLNWAGVSSTLPDWSIARTSKLCSPGLRLSIIIGELHTSNMGESILHSKMIWELPVKSTCPTKSNFNKVEDVVSSLFRILLFPSIAIIIDVSGKSIVPSSLCSVEIV